MQDSADWRLVLIDRQTTYTNQMSFCLCQLYSWNTALIMILWEINIGRSIMWMLSDIITSFNLHLKGHSYICRTYLYTFKVHNWMSYKQWDMTNGHKSLISRLNSTDNSLITNTMLRLVKKGRALNETPPHHLLRNDTCHMRSHSITCNTSEHTLP